MIRHFHQDFLLECPFREVSLQRYCLATVGSPWMSAECVPLLGEVTSIFDCVSPVTRRVNASMLDRMIDSEEDWQTFMEMVHPVDRLIIVNDRPFSTNAIVNRYDDCTMQAYLCRLLQAGIDCCYVRHAA